MERIGEDSVGEEHLDMTHGDAAEHGSGWGGVDLLPKSAEPFNLTAKARGVKAA